MADEIKKTVMVIDDDLLVTNLIKKSLEDEFIVRIYNNPMQAISEVSTVNPTLILLDVNMPNIDGMEVIKQIRRHPQTINIPIICISADGSYDLREKLDARGTLGFIKKPLDIKSLAGHIKSYLDSVNKIVCSSDGQHICTISHTGTEKYKLIFKKLKHTLSKGDKVVLLTWLPGKSGDADDVRQYIDDESLIWLEIKAISSIKMPYLNDLSPILDDIDSLCPGELEDYNLFFDDIKNLFNLQDRPRTISKSAELSKHLRLIFRKTNHYITQSSTGEENATLMKMATTLIGQGD